VSDKLASIRPTVLLVDDEPDERYLFRRELESAGMQVLECNSGREALQTLSELTPSVILLDVNMPLQDGIEVCREIRSKPFYKDIPILMLTGMEGVDYVNRAFDAGATDFITKSTNLDMLSQRVKYALRNSINTRALKSWQNQIKRAYEVAKIGYWQLNVKDARVTLSEEALGLFHLEATEFDNTFDGLLNLIHANDRESVNNVVDAALYKDGRLNVDFRIDTKNAEECYANMQGGVIFNDFGDPKNIMGVIQDITERKKSEATIQYQALYDSLTDLSNRRLFYDRLAQAMSAARLEEKMLAVCFFDLDNFKMINDNFGHAVGDELLKAVAKRLRGTIRQGDIVARISGDEFALAVEGLSNVTELEKIVEKLRFRLSQPYRVRGHKIFSSASIGVALYPLDSSNRETMLRNADAAMYHAKELGGNCYCYYTKDMNDRARRRSIMEKQLRNAIKLDELNLYFQPQIDSATNSIYGLEVLLRWQHPEYGLLSPSKFLSIAEDSGMIYSIGQWVFEKACNDLMRWQKMGHVGLCLALNISSQQFMQEGFIDYITKILDTTGIDPGLICLEITENVAMKQLSNTIDMLSQLNILGLRTAIDDFGAGHSSMNLLQKLPIDALNIDRSFIMRIAERERDGNTAKGIIALAHNLGLKVTAEGVETKAQADFLKNQKCDILQGYYFSHPLPVSDMDVYIQHYPSRLQHSGVIAE